MGRDTRNGVTHADRVTVSKHLTRVGDREQMFYFALNSADFLHRITRKVFHI